MTEDEEWELAEQRMNVIGQNGNTGEHYNKVLTTKTITQHLWIIVKPEINRGLTGFVWVNSEDNDLHNYKHFQKTTFTRNIKVHE